MPAALALALTTASMTLLGPPGFLLALSRTNPPSLRRRVGAWLLATMWLLLAPLPAVYVGLRCFLTVLISDRMWMPDPTGPAVRAGMRVAALVLGELPPGRSAKRSRPALSGGRPGVDARQRGDGARRAPRLRDEAARLAEVDRRARRAFSGPFAPMAPAAAKTQFDALRRIAREDRLADDEDPDVARDAREFIEEFDEV